MLSSVRYVALLVPLMFLSGHANAQAERDLAQEEENRRIVVEFYVSFFQDEDLTAAERCEHACNCDPLGGVFRVEC